jgi:hypothetical protein
VTRVVANHEHDPTTAHDFALVADLLDARSDFHGLIFSKLDLLISVGDASAGRVVGADFDGDAISGEDPDIVAPHATADGGEDLEPVVGCYPKHCVWEGLFDRGLKLEFVVLGLFGLMLAPAPAPSSSTAGHGSNEG